ncbi:hypothetical protein HMPREF1989_01201 [Porphyromonas gingivalis F0566]|nr:hypothetical protein HMPREF1989_01201 [Porphyromonas gingivalis F0566]
MAIASVAPIKQQNRNMERRYLIFIVVKNSFYITILCGQSYTILYFLFWGNFLQQDKIIFLRFVSCFLKK